MTTVELHNPTAPEPTTQDSLQDMPKIRESVVGVLENGKQHAKLILEEIARDLGDRYGVIHAITRNKPVSTPTDPGILDELAQSVDWVLIGSAD